ncbi:hypothetical protein [Streptomyces varsoviensis]|uniref:PBS lyase n=1 Tax=Streptomyces varsoviensis TaxID=67373 RepID=A0ABR5JDJ3_9ACTN|nr:hypothetical protein [Streptomyces varsoviensis]KOG91508.1 hypothetical protein ADK38_02775 [Streptomyces varsoviensis]
MDDDRWDGWPERWVGSDCDVRVAVSAIPREVRDGFRYDEVPWQRFRHFYGPGEEIPGLLVTLASADVEAADGALRQLWTSLHHQGGTIAVGALAVPFLLRIAATARPELRAQTLRLVAEVGRRQHMGDGSREGLLQVAEEPMMIDGSTMCPVNWTIQAARQAVTDDLHLLLPLLSDPAPDPDPEVRSVTAYVLAAATGEYSRVSSALRTRLAEEDDAVVRVSLILAIAQLAREHEHQGEHAPKWARGLWSDSGRPPEVRIGAGLAWLCLVTDPAPDELRALLTDPDTRQYDGLLQPVPWLTWIDPTGVGLRSCVDEMLRANLPENSA